MLKNKISYHLNDQTFPGIVVSLSLSTPAELDLKSLEVSLALHNFHERLKETKKIFFYPQDEIWGKSEKYSSQTEC